MKNGKYLILCIDDDQDLLDAMRLILEGEGRYIVTTANSAEEGLRKYRETRPDLILVDLMMEEVDAGASFVKELQAMGTPPPVYMLSSVGDGLNLSTDYSQLGLTGVLQKPVQPNVLLAMLKAKLR